MRVVADPPLHQWRITPRDGKQAVIATGHQAWLWHPGILAKDIAMAVAAQRQGAQTVHIVVDHDVHEALKIDVPVRVGQELRVQTLRFGEELAGVPSACQPAPDPHDLHRGLRNAMRRVGSPILADLRPLLQAMEKLGRAQTLAQTIAELTVRLMSPYTRCPRLLYTSRLLATPAGEAMVGQILRDARRCIAAYNAAVDAHPHAGVARLSIEPERVEAPLWNLAMGAPRQRVFIDLAVEDDPILTFEDGTPILEHQRWLAPKALLLTAVMRSAFCDLFIHGKGGGVYDELTEAWLKGWTDQPLAPRAVVSADVYLDFDTPVADRRDVERAVWYRHHLPHNVDRVLGVNGELVNEKRALLARMDDDRDRRRRRAAFKRVHEINARLAAEHAAAIAEAETRVATARAGVRNAAVARKRDWSFPLYPHEKLAALRDAISATA